MAIERTVHPPLRPSSTNKPNADQQKRIANAMQAAWPLNDREGKNLGIGHLPEKLQKQIRAGHARLGIY